MIRKIAVLCSASLLGACALTPGLAAQSPVSAGPLMNYLTSLSLPPVSLVSVAIPHAQAPLLTYGFDERARTEDWNNIYENFSTADDVHKQLRMRSRLWGALSTPHSELQAFVKLNNEFNKSISPDVRLNNNELFFDNLYLTLNKTYIPHLTLSAGRMDFFKENGLIFADGTPGDGSRSSYFNLVDFAYHRNGSELEAIGILGPRQDRFLPIVHNQHRYLADWDEQAFALYYTDRSWENTDYDLYYVLKKEVHNYREPLDPLFQPDKTIDSLGGYLSHRYALGMSLKAEGTMQWSRVHANPVQAFPAVRFNSFGGYVNFTKQFTSTWGGPFLIGSYSALSGSDKQVNGAGFDPLFSRWAAYSELYVYTQLDEKAIAYPTNDHIFEAAAGWSPLKSILLRAALYQHEAFQSIGAFNPSYFGSGLNRGENAQLRLDWTAGKSWSGHALWEHWWTGDFYSHRNPIQWVRFEIVYSTHGTLSTHKKQEMAP